MKYYYVERYPHAAGYEIQARDWRHALKIAKETDRLQYRVRLINTCNSGTMREYRMDKTTYTFAIRELT